MRNCISNKIRQVRKEKGLSQEMLGKMLGVSQTTIGQYETLRISIGVDSLEKIAVALETPISYFLSDLESEKLYHKEKTPESNEPSDTAKQKYALYVSYIDAGFTQEQAFILINK